MEIGKSAKIEVDISADGPVLICCLQKIKDKYNREINNGELIMWHFLPPPIPQELQDLFDTDMKTEMVLPQWLLKEKFSDDGDNSCAFQITNFIDELYGKWSIITVYQADTEEKKYYQYKLDTVEFV